MLYEALLCLAGSNTVLSRSLIGLSVCDSHALGSVHSVVVPCVALSLYDGNDGSPIFKLCLSLVIQPHTPI